MEADARTRTADPFITSEVLYQLSYVGAGLIVAAPAPPSGLASQPAAVDLALERLEARPHDLPPQ